MKKDFAGITVPLITPLTENGGLDKDGLERLINYVLAGGVDSVFILGTTGEGPSLAEKTKAELILSTNVFLNGRAKCLVGTTHTAPEESIKLGRLAAENGADAIVIAPPPYFPFTQQELEDYTREVVRQSPKPVMLYNIPRMTKISFLPETIARLTNEAKIVGVKDSSRDLDYLREVIAVSAERPDWTILTGFEDLLVASMEAGAHGGVLGGANVFPKLVKGFYNAIIANDMEAMLMQKSRLDAYRKIYGLGNGSVPGIQAIKYALEIKGICNRTMAFPFKALDDDAGQIVRQVMAAEAQVKQTKEHGK